MAHGRHVAAVVAPESGEKVPAVQAPEQCVAAREEEKVPAEQLVQTAALLAPVATEYVPALQLVQKAALLAPVATE